jgi:large subunit ribosomal protein L4
MKDGSQSGSVDLNPGVFDVAPNETLVHEVIVALQNAKRQGNAETKTRRLVSGGGAKPYRQKGTGSARHGSSREPQMRGGGVVFGPHKRSYRQKVPTAFRRKALCCVLSDRARNDNVAVLESLECPEPKTKPFADLLANVSTGGATLFVTAEINRNAVLSARNLGKVAVTTASDLNALDVAGARRIVIERNALTRLEERLA